MFIYYHLCNKVRISYSDLLFQKMYTFTAEQIEIEAPFRAVLLGEMQTGKSFFATKLVENLEHVCYNYGIYSSTNIVLIRKITFVFTFDIILLSYHTIYQFRLQFLDY